jgi:hypothetical protein
MKIELNFRDDISYVEFSGKLSCTLSKKKLQTPFFCLQVFPAHTTGSAFRRN